MTATASEPGRLRLNAGGLFEVLPVLEQHDPANPSATLGQLLGPPREVGDGVVVISRYEDCRAVLRDPRTRRSLRLSAAFEEQGTSFLTGLDPPEHTRTRRLLGAAFTPRVVEELRPAIEALVDDHLDAVAGRPAFDLAASFSRPVPIAALCALIGIPADDVPRISVWSEPISYGADLLAPPRSRAQQREYRETVREFRPYLRDLLHARRAEPQDDLLSRLATVADGDERLSDREIIANTMGLLVAGHETTVSTIGHGILWALRQPDGLPRLASGDPDEIAAFTDETLRMDCPLQATPRVVGEDMVVGGVPLARGTSMILLLGVANRDPDAFSEPDAFRPGAHTARHLGLGVGLHYCVGAGLGKLEAGVALPRVAQRLVDPQLVAGGVGYAGGWGLRSPQRIEVTAAEVLPRTTPWR